TAALSNYIDPFIPTLLGEGLIGQFRTIATLGPGFYLALLGSILILVGLYFQRKAYKPLADAAKEAASSGEVDEGIADDKGAAA
ncbi:MAG: hypothetical protein JSW55_00420, partial [Chloroflexota bacterium]